MRVGPGPTGAGPTLGKGSLRLGIPSAVFAHCVLQGGSWPKHGRVEAEALRTGTILGGHQYVIEILNRRMMQLHAAASVEHAHAQAFERVPHVLGSSACP